MSGQRRLHGEGVVTVSVRNRIDPWLAGIGLMAFIMLLPFSSYVAAFQSVREAWQIDGTAASILYSAYLLGSALSALIFLPQLDRLPVSHVTVAGVAVNILTHLLFPLLAGSFWSAALLRLAGGGAYIVAYMGGVQWVARRYHLGKGKAVSIFVGAGYAGTTSSYLLSGLLLEHFGDWRTVYMITAVVSVAALPLGLWLLAHSGLETLTRRRSSLDLSVLRLPSLLLVIGVYALHSAELYLARLWLPQFLGVNLALHGVQAAEARGVALAGVMFIPGAVSVMAGGWLSDRVRRRRTAAIIFGISGICSLTLGWLVALPPFLVIGIGFIYGLFTAADSSIYSTAVTEITPGHQLGSAQAVQSLAGFLVAAVVPVMAGSILDANESLAGWGFAFTFCASLALIGLALLQRMRPVAPLPA